MTDSDGKDLQKSWFGVKFKKKPCGISYAANEQQAMHNVWHRLLRRQQKLTLDQALPFLTAAQLTSPAEWKGKIKPEKSKIKWEAFWRGHGSIGSTRAVSAAKACDNRWFSLFKSQQEVVTEDTKQIYHEEIFARPVFGQEKVQAGRPRKVSHRQQLSLFSH